MQLAYTPHVATLLPLVQTVDEVSGQYISPESTPLFFPSSLPSEMRGRPELKEICDAERTLREPQADDALADVRRFRRIIQGLWQFKKLNASGTGNKPNTRMLDMYTRIDKKLQCAANRYRIAYNSLLVLDPNGTWKERLHELKPSDIRGPGRDPDHPEDGKTSKGRFIPSWIWLVPRLPCERGDDQTEDEFNDSMRAEWAQTRARMCRWEEELMIIQEEMRRVVAFFEWRSTWWLEQGNRRTDLEPSIQSGVAAYAHKQADICLRMAARCATYWLPIMKKHGIFPSWGEKYTQRSTVSLEIGPASDSENDDDNDELDRADEKSDSGDLEVDDILEFD